MPSLPKHDFDGCDDDIVELYLKMAAHQIKSMGVALRSNRMTKIQHLAHKLAGSSAFLGQRVLAERLRELEVAASQTQTKEAGQLLGVITEQFGDIRRRRMSVPSLKTPLQTTAPIPKSKRKYKIYIVDDHPLVREGLVRLINLQPDLALCGQADTAHHALKAIPILKPDVVILDITLAGSDGMGLIKDMKLRALKTSILVLSMHDESLYAERALRAGAKGYLMKLEAPHEVLKAIHCILSGEIYLSDKMSAKMLHKVAGGKSDDKALPEGSLSDRELQVFQLIGQGQGTRQIAEGLHISAKTVESYRAHIKVKMNLSNAHELTQHAVHWVESNHLN